MSRLGAVVLAGGLARRMGGVDKGLVPLGGRPMIAYALAAVAPRVDAIVVNANRNADAYGALVDVHGGTVVADRHAGHLGPLAGLAAALHALDASRVFLCPCDSPFVAPALVDRLAEACAAPDVDIAVAHDGERLQPVFCIVERHVLPSLETFLASGERKIDRWYAGEAMRAVDCRDLAGSFRNVNTEEERVAAERELALGRTGPGPAPGRETAGDGVNVDSEGDAPEDGTREADSA